MQRQQSQGLKRSWDAFGGGDGGEEVNMELGSHPY